MTTMLRHSLLILAFVVMQTAIHAQSVGINDDATLPHASAILDIKVSAAAKKGVLIPRMTVAQRIAIVKPAKGLLVYDSTINSFWFHNGTSWQEIAKGANAWTVNGINVYNLGGNIGIGVTTPRAKLNVVQNSNVLFGLSMTGLGRKLIWHGTKAAFRAGEVLGQYPYDTPPLAWDDANIGYASFATGTDVIASGRHSAAFGQSTAALGEGSIAAGFWSISEGASSVALGFLGFSKGDNSIAAGNSCSAGGENSAAFNESNESEGTGSFTGGLYNVTNGDTQNKRIEIQNNRIQNQSKQIIEQEARLNALEKMMSEYIKSKESR